MPFFDVLVSINTYDEETIAEALFELVGNELDVSCVPPQAMVQHKEMATLL